MDAVQLIVEQFLSSKEPQSLIGVHENSYLDFKEQFYEDNITKYYELAKDVTSFANADGGYIIIGINTDRSKDTDTEISTEVCMVSDYTAKANGLIRETIYPKMEPKTDYEVQYIELDADSRTGVLVIRINKSQKRRLIAKIVDNDKKMRNIVFGYAVRKGANSEPDSIDEIYKKMQSGFNSHNQLTEQISSDVTIIRELIERNPNSHSGYRGSLLEERMDQE